MKIVIDAIPLLSPITGVGNYILKTANLLRELGPEHDYTYFYGYYSKKIITYTEDRGRFYRIKELVKKMPAGSMATRRLKGVINKFIDRRFDLYFEPNYVPINIKAKRVVASVHDFSWKIRPEWHPRDRCLYFEDNFWRSVDRMDRIIVVSNYIRDEAVSLGLPEEKISVVYEAVDTDIFRRYPPELLSETKRKYELPDDFILFVGSVEPRKNLTNLIHAYLALESAARKNLKLVIAGFKGWKNREVMELFEKASGDVLYTGYVPDEDLGKFYCLATAFVFPSLYEGFGFPPLEAMACGCPVIASNVSSIPEICGDAALYIDPLDAESITDGIRRVISEAELRKNLASEGLRRVGRFSWKKTALEHLEIFREVSEN